MSGLCIPESPTRGQNASKISPGWLVGYNASNIWKIWIPSTQQILISRDVHFDESICYKDAAPNQHINLIDPPVSPYDYFDLNKDTFPEVMEGSPELEDYQDDQENRVEDDTLDHTTPQNKGKQPGQWRWTIRLCINPLLKRKVKEIRVPQRAKEVATEPCVERIGPGRRVGKLKVLAKVSGQDRECFGSVEEWRELIGGPAFHVSSKIAINGRCFPFDALADSGASGYLFLDVNLGKKKKKKKTHRELGIAESKPWWLSRQLKQNIWLWQKP